jgi:phage FluMu protein Com
VKTFLCLTPDLVNDTSSFSKLYRPASVPAFCGDEMDRCPKCNKLLMAMSDRKGRTEHRCLKCDNIDPMKASAIKWAEAPLAGPKQSDH